MKREMLLKSFYLGTDRYFPEQEIDAWFISLGIKNEGSPPEKLAKALMVFYMLEKGAAKVPVKERDGN
jgi:hypothetical protein